jgi:hypothetical protein
MVVFRERDTGFEDHAHHNQLTAALDCRDGGERLG